jgi:hypothetical protein
MRVARTVGINECQDAVGRVLIVICRSQRCLSVPVTLGPWLEASVDTNGAQNADAEDWPRVAVFAPMGEAGFIGPSPRMSRLCQCATGNVADIDIIFCY